MDEHNRPYDVSSDVAILITALAERLHKPATPEYGLATAVLELIEKVARSERDRMVEALSDVVGSIDLVEEAETDPDPLPF
jgi:hypothetical protein